MVCDVDEMPSWIMLVTDQMYTTLGNQSVSLKHGWYYMSIIMDRQAAIDYNFLVTRLNVTLL